MFTWLGTMRARFPRWISAYFWTVVAVNILVLTVLFIFTTKFSNWILGILLVFTIIMLWLSSIKVHIPGTQGTTNLFPGIIPRWAWVMISCVFLLLVAGYMIAGEELLGSGSRAFKVARHNSATETDAETDQAKLFVVSKGKPQYELIGYWRWSEEFRSTITTKEDITVTDLDEKREVNSQTLRKVALPDKHGRSIEATSAWFAASDLVPKKQYEVDKAAKEAEEKKKQETPVIVGLKAECVDKDMVKISFSTNFATKAKLYWGKKADVVVDEHNTLMNEHTFFVTDQLPGKYNYRIHVERDNGKTRDSDVRLVEIQAPRPPAVAGQTATSEPQLVKGTGRHPITNGTIRLIGLNPQIPYQVYLDEAPVSIVGIEIWRREKMINDRNGLESANPKSCIFGLVENDVLKISPAPSSSNPYKIRIVPQETASPATPVAPRIKGGRV